DCCRNYDTPATLRLANGPREITIKQQIVQGGIALIRLHDAVEKSRANDAAASPNCRDVAEIKVPVVDFACASKQLHPLGVRNNFRRVSASRTISTNRERLPLNLRTLGCGKIFDAATRSSLRAEMTRASTAALIVEITTDCLIAA